MKEYDINQIKAIEASSGYNMVLASPGSGKTEILAERIAYAMKNGVKPEDMLCLTFTNRAAKGMNSRIKETVKDVDTQDIFIGNIHRFCINFLFDNEIVPENSGIIDDDDKSCIIQKFNKPLFSKKGEPDKTKIKYVVDLATYITQKQLQQPDDFLLVNGDFAALYKKAEEIAFDCEGNTDNEMLEAALKYLKRKEERHYIDFNDILILTYNELLKNPDKHKKYRWIQVDEVQDLNALQLAVIDCLTDKSSDFTVMYLGDEQQAIFSFTGSKLEILYKLQERCKNNIFRFATNYRSEDYLTEVCNTYAEKELGVDPAILPHSNNHTEKKKNDLILCESTSANKETERILGMIKYYLGQSKDERLAILVPNNSAADEISKKIDEHNGKIKVSDENVENPKEKEEKYKYFKISGDDMFRSLDYQAIMALLNIAVNEFNYKAWISLLSGIKYGDGRLMSKSEAWDLVETLKGHGMTPSDLFNNKTYLQRFLETYDNKEMVFFDTETTGLNILEDDIVQIAAFKVKNGKKVDGSDFNIIMETDKKIPETLGDIVNPLVKEYAEKSHLCREEGLKKFIDYIGDDPVLGHNMQNYDFPILGANITNLRANTQKTLGMDKEYEVFDSLYLIKYIRPDLKSYKLKSLLEKLKLEGENSHLADADIEATYSVVDYCANKLRAAASSTEFIVEEIRDKEEILQEFLSKEDVIQLKEKIRNSDIKTMIENIRNYLYTPAPVGEEQGTLKDLLEKTHKELSEKGIIDPLGEKFTLFLDYVEKDLNKDEDEKEEIEDKEAKKDNEVKEEKENIALIDQLRHNIRNLTYSISEADLINSEKLKDVRTFIMTTYKAKGLEFDNVIIYGAVDGTYPFYSHSKVLNEPFEYSKAEIEKAEKGIKEDARKFYVAISRAKKRLCVSYAVSRLTNYGLFRQELTPFMNSIKQYFKAGK